jgi:hypothetical protein
MVLILAGAAIGIGVLAGIFYYIINREGESRRLAEAMTALEQKKYAEAELLFDKFLQAYPKAESSDKARLNRLKARVEKNIMTTTPDVKQGLKELEDLIRLGKDLQGYEDERDRIRLYADRLTFAGARVAEISQQQEPLDISVRAMEILRRFSPEPGIPADREEVLVRHQRIGEAAVIKRTAFEETVGQIRSLLAAGNTVEAVAARQSLIDRYELLSEDKDVEALLTEILKAEQLKAERREVGQDAVTEDSRTVHNSLSLTLRTQASNDLIPGGRRVFAMGRDSVVAVDSDSGDPLWKHIVGSDSSFAPVPLSASPPALLVHHSRSNELMLLDQADGRLIWRQSVGSRPSGAPLIHEQQIYLTTDDGQLWQISAGSGRIISCVRFSQGVVGPPALSGDGRHMLIAGDSVFLYTLTVNPLACTAVSCLNHRTGSVQSPILTAGSVYLMCDNDVAAKCRVRVLAMNPESGSVAVRAAEFVDGHVRDTCLLRGGELFVPSDPQRVTAFRVSDDVDQPALTRTGANQLEEGLQTKMFLLAGPGGQLWLGGRSLRRFQLRTNGLSLEEGVTGEGIHLQPIQFLDEGLFLTSRDESLSSVFFTHINREQMKGVWRIVVSSTVVAAGEGSGEGNLLALTDFGEVYRISPQQLESGGFATESISRFRLPEKLSSAVRGLRINDGRLGAYCGAPEPALWTIMPTGQLERKWNLPGIPQCEPVSIAAGVVFCLPGRIHLTAARGGAAVEDYRAAHEGDANASWKALVALNAAQVLAVTQGNELVRVEYREKPRPQMAEVSVTAVNHPIELSPAVGGGMICIATADGRLIGMKDSTLEVMADVDLGGVPSGVPVISGNRLFVEIGASETRVFALDQGLKQCGVIPAEGGGCSDIPWQLSDNSFLMAGKNGVVKRLNMDGNPAGDVADIGQSLVRGPFQAGNRLLVMAADGTLFPLPDEAGRP